MFRWARFARLEPAFGAFSASGGGGQPPQPANGGLWLAAAAYGDTDPHTVGAPVFAHTTPVYVDGRRVGRAASARWCLRLLDGVEELAGERAGSPSDTESGSSATWSRYSDRARASYRSVS